MHWRAYVDGERFDLDDAMAQFPDDKAGPVWFGEDSTGTYFCSAELDASVEQGRLEQVSGSLMARVNASARLIDRTFRPLALTMRFEDGAGNQTVILGTVAFEGRARLHAAIESVGPDGVSSVAPRPLASRLVELGEKDPLVEEAMRILGSPDTLGWVDLYKVFEIVRDDVGGLSQLVATRWTSRKSASSFTASANRRDVSGDAARHARNSGPTPDATRVMTLAEGTEYICDVSRHWMLSRL